MSKLRITKRSVEQLAPQRGRFVVWDEDLPAFGVEVSPSGSRAYKLMYRQRGRLRKLTLGRHGSITADEARDLAKKALGAVAHGRDPAEEKLIARRAVTLGVAFEDWLARHVTPKLKASTAEEYRRLFDKVIKPALGGRPLPDVSRADVAALHKRHAKSPYAANRLVAVLRSFFNWAERHGLRPEGANPARLIEPYRERSRERYLTADELGALGKAIRGSAIEEWPFAVAAIMLLIFTGARRGEILGLRWAEVDLANGTARLPDSKTGPKTLYLSAPARQLLDTLPRVSGNPYVIPGRLKGSPLIGLPRVWRRVRARAGLPDLRIHDLRHAFASSAAMGGQPLLVIGRLLGHSQPAVTDRYSHFASSPLVTAADGVAGAIADHLQVKDLVLVLPKRKGEGDAPVS